MAVDLIGRFVNIRYCCSISPDVLIDPIISPIPFKPQYSDPNQHPAISLNGLSLIGRVIIKAGGVGRNTAECIAHLGTAETSIISTVGGSQFSDINGQNSLVPDYFADYLVQHASKNDLSIHPIIIDGQSTSVYNAILYDDGELRGAVCDFNSLDFLTPQRLIENNFASRIFAPFHETERFSPSIFVLDANLPVEVLQWAAKEVRRSSKSIVWALATSAAKVPKVVDAELHLSAHIISMNASELEQLSIAAGVPVKPGTSTANQLHSLLNSLPPTARGLVFIVTMGGAGVGMLFYSLHALLSRLVALTSACLTTVAGSFIPIDASCTWERILKWNPNKQTPGDPHLLHLPALELDKMVDVTGAGDCFAAGTMTGLLRKLPLPQALQLGLKASKTCIETGSIASIRALRHSASL
jgi:sugar/nucleoside kinase (ribokinase family)